ncbi:MAG: AI-2E family transporter [Candidatus Levyibacteriota bacterium]
MLQRFFDYLSKNQVVFALFIIFSAWFLFQIREILFSLFLSYIIMAAILPITQFLRKKRVPKLLSVLIPYFSIVILLFLLIIPLIPFVVSQIESLILGFPKYLDQSAKFVGLKINPHELQGYFNAQLANLSSSALTVTTQVFGGIFTAITIFIVSLYLLLYNDIFKKKFARLFHHHTHDKVLTTIDLVNEKLGAWLQGQMILSASIGMITWASLTMLGVPFSLPLGLLAGVLEILPTFGPTLAAIPAVIVALTISPGLAIVVIITYIVIQALENQLLVPKIMERAVGLNPVAVIIGVTVGANLMGIVGALLSIPFISFILVIYRSLEAQK